MKKSHHRITPGRVLLVLIFIFLYAPIVYTVFFSFNASRSMTKFTGFSLQWYEKMFASSSTMNAVITTFVIAILATILSTVIGTITTIGLSRCRRVLRSAVGMINDIVLMNPEIVTGIGLLMFFATLMVNKGFLTMLLAHVMFCTPYVMLTVAPRLRSLDPNLADAALDLGCTPLQAVTKVIVPQLMPGITAGALIAFTMSFDDFVISYFVTGNGVQNISILVYTMSKRINPSINAISTLVIVIITIALLLINIIPMLRRRSAENKEVQI